jgi:phosphatidylglycerophosphatase A
VARPDAAAPAPGRRLRVWVATGGGVGYAPVAPGTFGSLPGVALAWLAMLAGGTTALVATLVAVVALGLWAAGVAESHFGRSDPGPVVIDEIAGQLVSLLFIAPTPAALAAAFVLFRVFDVLKPFPARRLESLPGAYGIMADDLMAGIYANLALRALQWAVPGWWSG